MYYNFCTISPPPFFPHFGSKMRNPQIWCSLIYIYIDMAQLWQCHSQQAKLDGQCWLTHSHLPCDMVIRWSWNQHCWHFFLNCLFGVDVPFVSGFIIFLLWANAAIADSMTRPIGLFQILCLGLSSVYCLENVTDQYAQISFFFSFQSDTQILPEMGLVRFSFQIIVL